MPVPQKQQSPRKTSPKAATTTAAKGQKPNRFWNFVTNAATEAEPESVELRIDGDIVDDNDAWIYEWFGVPAASPNAFRDELSQHSGQDLTLWIDSYGGSVYAAAGIYNALKEHDGNITVKITKAMSAASVIAMAGDKVLMSPVGVMMIHNPLSSVEGGYSSDLRKAADVLDEVKETIINAYELKTGQTHDEISALMDAETFMSAKTAVDNGFADGILYDDTQKSTEPINFLFSRVTMSAKNSVSVERLMEIASIAEGQSTPETATATPAVPENKICHEEVNQMAVEITNAANLKEQLPVVYTEVLDAGVTAERTRLKAFDELNGKVDPEYLASAKYEDGATAEKVLFNAMKDGKLINSAYVADAAKDAENANKVPGAASDGTKTDDDAAILDRIQNTARKTLGIGGSK